MPFFDFFPVVPFLSECNTFYIADLFDTNDLPLCYQETVGIMRYLASLVDDLGPDSVSRSDLMEWFRIVTRTNQTSGRSYEGYLGFLVVLSFFDDYVLIRQHW